jgi:hypothetical protein
MPDRNAACSHASRPPLLSGQATFHGAPGYSTPRNTGFQTKPRCPFWRPQATVPSHVTRNNESRCPRHCRQVEIRSHQAERSDDGPPIAALSPCMRRIPAWQLGQDAHCAWLELSRNAAARNVTDQARAKIFGNALFLALLAGSSGDFSLITGSFFALRGPLRPDTAHRRLRLDVMGSAVHPMRRLGSQPDAVFSGMLPFVEDPGMHCVGSRLVLMFHRAFR